MQNSIGTIRANVIDSLDEILTHKARVVSLIDLLMQAGAAPGSAIDGNSIGCVCSFIMDELEEIGAQTQRALSEVEEMEREASWDTTEHEIEMARRIYGDCEEPEEAHIGEDGEPPLVDCFGHGSREALEAWLKNHKRSKE